MRKEYLDQRLASIERVCDESELDAVLLTSGELLKYAADFHHPGFLIIGSGSPVLITDGRFIQELSDADARFKKLIYRGKLIDYLKDNGLLKAGQTGIEGGDVSWRFYTELSGKLSSVTFTDISIKLNELISIHDDESLSRIKSAIEISHKAFTQLKNYLQPGITEAEAAAQLTLFTKQAGASGDAFDPIVAFGANTAKPHAVPGTAKLKEGDVVLTDTGSFYEGLCCDFTRCFVFGEGENPQFNAAADIIDQAIEAALEHLKPDQPASEPDLAVRRVFADHGVEDKFLHSAGHGLGYKVHGYPRVSRNSGDRFCTRQVVAIEPGLYYSENFGARTENNYYIAEKGFSLLTDF